MSLFFIVSNMFTKSQKNYNTEETETRSEVVGVQDLQQDFYVNLAQHF